MYDLSKWHRQGLYRVPDKGEILSLLGFQGVSQLICGPYPVIVNSVFAQISRYAQEPRLSMGAVFKVWDRLEKLEQRVLQDLLRVTYVVQIGIRQPEDAVSIFIQDALGLADDFPPVQRLCRLR